MAEEIHQFAYCSAIKIKTGILKFWRGNISPS
jgi:hypothetical protein